MHPKCIPKSTFGASWEFVFIFEGSGSPKIELKSLNFDENYKKNGIGKNQPYIVYKAGSGKSSFIPGGMECNLLIVETLVAKGIKFVIKDQSYHHPGNQDNTVKFFGQSGQTPL